NAVEAEWHSDCRVANAAVKAHRLDYDRMKERAEKAEAERDDAFATVTLQYKPKLEAAEETIDDLNRCVIREHERANRAEDARNAIRDERDDALALQLKVNALNDLNYLEIARLREALEKADEGLNFLHL